MRSISKWKKTVLLSFTAAALTFAVAANRNGVTVWAAPASGVCITDNVVVRESAVNGAQIGGLSEGQEITIQDETRGEDGNIWYEITFELNGSERTGWVRSDLIDTTVPASVQTASGDDTENIEGETDDTQEQVVQLETGTGYVTLTDIPEEEAAKLSDRFAACICEFEEGSVTAYQLSTADELVAEDASLVDFYYVYGTNELGVSGWYIYDANEGTIQRNLSNMQYEITADPEEDADSANEFDRDSISKMLTGVLAVVCILLLVLTIIFSIRYRRLRRLLEEEMGEDEADKKSRRREEPEERKKTENPDEEQLFSQNTQNDSELDIIELFDNESGDENDSDFEMEKRELEDLERILSREFSEQEPDDSDNEEREGFDDDDDDDDDLEFL